VEAPRSSAYNGPSSQHAQLGGVTHSRTYTHRRKLATASGRAAIQRDLLHFNRAFFKQMRRPKKNSRAKKRPAFFWRFSPGEIQKQRVFIKQPMSMFFDIPKKGAFFLKTNKNKDFFPVAMFFLVFPCTFRCFWSGESKQTKKIPANKSRSRVKNDRPAFIVLFLFF
jgi:hypothetical protein